MSGVHIVVFGQPFLFTSLGEIEHRFSACAGYSKLFFFFVFSVVFVITGALATGACLSLLHGLI